MAKIESISLKKLIIPEGTSGGTGYDERAELIIRYSNGSEQSVNVSAYFTNYNSAFVELYEALPSIDNPSETYDMLVQAIGNRLFEADKADLDKKYLEPKRERKSHKIYRIRKLTPRECGRLMGCNDEDISLIQNYPLVPGPDGTWVLPDGMTDAEAKKLRISESQQYKMFGNSIVVQVLEGIFTQMFRADSDSLF